MKPGRELDALVAEKVMEWERIHKHGSRLFGVPPGIPGIPSAPAASELPYYSTNIAAAREVVEKLKSLKFSFALYFSEFNSEWNVDLDNKIYIAADTAPHAICLAALKAVGVEI